MQVLFLNHTFLPNMLYEYIIIYDYKTEGKKEGNTTACHWNSKITSLYLIYSQEVS